MTFVQVLLLVPALVSCAMGIYHVMLVSTASHDQKYPVTPYFDHLDLWNAIVLLMMSLDSPVADSHTNDMT